MHVFRPTASSNVWAIDVAQTSGSFATVFPSPETYDVTIPGITTVTNGALVLAVWVSRDNNTWALQTAGWANAGNTQYRNGDGSDTSQSSGYKVMATAGTSGNVTNRQTSSAGDSGNWSILAFKEVQTTTLGTGSDPAAAIIAPGAAATDVNQFTLQTSTGTETVSSVTVNLSTNSGVARLAITDAAGTELGYTAAPATGSNTIAVSGLSATTTLTTFKVRVTPFSHATMPAVPGAAYAITAPVTAWAGPNNHVGSDTNVNALTIDNQSPASATATSGSAGYLSVALNWTTSASSDFAASGGSVIYRWAGSTAGGEVPAEGSSPAVGAANGTATVACVVSSAAGVALSKINGTGGSAGECATTALMAGQAYTYKVFQRDTNGNFDAGVVIGTFTPFGAVSPTLSTVVAIPTSVPADNYTTATITVTLKDSAGTPVPGKSVTLAAGAGSSTITTVSGVSDASGVATFKVKDGTVETITYTATDTTDSIVIAQTAQVDFTTPSLCFTDDFNRATLLETGNWTRTRGAGTSLDPEIVSNRLRLTDAAGSRATAVHLHRLFPGANNKVVATFDYYSYNGSGADGLAMTLSDSSIAPVAGAFGGSLGYAQKCQSGVGGCSSDCTVAGGCPGFSGGWIGIGLDEYGNYSNPTEGRVDGPGFQSNTITIRGSGSGQSGYNYHTRASAPGLASSGSTPAPGHRYRITVDHSDGVHAYVTLDRDTTGTGTSYTNIIPTYDAKAITTQAAVPPYWFFSFSASTGGSTNIHEIDNLEVCTGKPMITPSLDHVRIVHDGSALTCRAETITLKACADASCSALYTGSVTVDLAPISGATWSTDPVTFSGGQAQVTLAKATVGGVTLGGAVTAPSVQSAVCYNGATAGDCTLTYSSNACLFDAVEPAQNPGTPIYTKLAGTAFTVDVLALTAGAINTGFTGAVTVDLVDMTGRSPAACDPAWAAIATPTSPTSPYTFTLANAGRRTFTFSYANAAKDVRVRMRNGGNTACSSDNFAIRPTSFSVTSPDATNTASTGTPVIKAGEAFGLDAASVTGYTGTAQINNYRVEAHGGAAQNGSIGGSFSPATAATSYISKGTAFTYSEVGNFRFVPWGVYDDGSFADVDRGKATPECFIDAKIGTGVDPANPNAKDGNSKYGCYFGTTAASAYFGRFIPHHFGVTGTVVNRSDLAAPGGTYSYMGEPMALVLAVTAYNKAEGATQNYKDSFAKLDAATLGAVVANWTCTIGAQCMGLGVASGANLTARLGIDTVSQNSAVPANTTTAAGVTSGWAGGTSYFKLNAVFNRVAAPDGPYATLKFGAKPLDSDGVTLPPRLSGDTTHCVNLDISNGNENAACDPGAIEANLRRKLFETAARFGRLHLYNAYGSELLAPRVEYRAEFWNGTRWATNTDDSATAIAAAHVATGGLVLNNVGALANGVGFLTFAIAGVGSYDTAVNLGSTPNDTSCNTAHPVSTAARMPWLQGFWGAPASCGGVAAWAQDPSARVRLGSPMAPFIFMRESY
jgi:MSHA biogenesis protein MshQ